jgi:alkylmercury lyase
MRRRSRPDKRTTALDIRALAGEFTAAHPRLDPAEQRLVLAAFRLLGEGRAFTDRELAERTGLPPAEIHMSLGPSMIERDDQERVLGLGGLTLEPTKHVLELDGRTLYAWCALDTLFLPELLGRPARVRSSCPETGEAVSLRVDDGGVTDVTPAGAVMSLHDAEGLELEDVRGTFCCYVHFFASEEAARIRARRSEGTFVVSIAEGFEYGRHYNRGRLGAALEGEGA